MLGQCEVRQVQCPVSGRTFPRRPLSRALAREALLIMMVAANVRVLVFGSGIAPADSLLAGHPMVGGWFPGGFSVAGGLATAVAGTAVLAGRVSAFQAMLWS